MPSLPFTIHGVYSGLFDLEGVARLESSALVLEFRTRHFLTEFFKSRPKEIRIPLADIEAATFQRRLLRGVLKIRAARLDAFSGMPGAAGTELKLRCRREYFDDAQDIASRISMTAVTHGLRELIAANDCEARGGPNRPSGPPPKPTS